MTCQWCKHYRRRGGIPLCLTVDDCGRVTPVKIGRMADGCSRFDPRKSCTTCEFRCSSDEKELNLESTEGCPKWKLKDLSTWGGNRRYARRSKTRKTKEAV